MTGFVTDTAGHSRPALLNLTGVACLGGRLAEVAYRTTIEISSQTYRSGALYLL
jgi:hypothetical protein